MRNDVAASQIGDLLRGNLSPDERDALLVAMEDSEELTELTGEQLHEILQPEATILYLRDPGGSYEPAFVRGKVVAPAFEATSLLVASLRVRNGPLTSEAVMKDRSGVELSQFDRAALETLGLPVALPIRRQLDLVGFLCLGPKRSGDVYTSTDMALLTAVSDRVSSGLSGFDQAQLLDAGRAMQESLRRYVPGAIAEQIEAGEDLEAGEREVTVLFVDIRGYTRMSEGRESGEIFSTINRYTDAVSRVVRAHGGSVVEFNGDGMMVVFGAPRELRAKERSAVEAAREMIREVSQLVPDGGDPDPDNLSVGVGVATGEAYVGNIQAVDRMIWSAIGNTTNLAARLEGLTRTFNASIVIDSSTYHAAGDAAADFSLRAGEPVRGKREPQDLYLMPLWRSRDPEDGSQ